MTSQVSPAEQIQQAAKGEVNVGGETLVVSKSYLWRNDQPRATSLAEEAFRATLPDTRPTHIALTLRRKGDSSANADLESSVLPYIVALHIIRDSRSSPFTVQDTAPAASNSAQFTWPAPPSGALAAISAQAEASAQEGAYFLAAPMDGGSALGLRAWNGPAWSSLRNGIDDMIDYHAIIEFEGGVFLTSSKQRLQVVH